MIDIRGININIYNATDMNKSELDFLEDWFNSEFGYIEIEWAKPQWYLIMKYDNEIIGRIGIIRRRININSKNLEISGITGVIVKEQFRGKKLSKIVLQKATNFIKDKLKLKFALLLCRDEVVPIYEKCNWYIVKGPTLFEQTTGLKEYSKNTMVINLSNNIWPDGIINLKGLSW